MWGNFFTGNFPWTCFKVNIFKHPEKNKFKNVFGRMFLKDLIEMMGMKTSKTFSEQNIYKTIVHKCCLNVLCVLFIKHFMMNVCKIFTG